MILLNPSIHSESQSTAVTPFIYNTFPTSLGYLAGYLREYNKLTPRIIDENISSLDREKIKTLIARDTGPKIVGITALTISSCRAFKLAGMIKEMDPEYVTVLGGIHPTVLPEECLNDTAIDIVVRGEGEKTLSEIVDCLGNGRDYKGIKGISYKNSGSFMHNPGRELIDINSVPPFPYDLFDSTYVFYRDFGTVISSRGCPYDCIFCSQRAISGQRYRYIDNERVLCEIELLIDKYKQKKIWFMDDNFLVKKARVFSLLEGIIARGFHKKAAFVAEMRGESVTYEVLYKMKEANFKIASFGMETASQRLLDLINKREKVEDNIRAVRMAHEVGIGTSATFIFGLPTETRKERLATAKLARKIPLDDARFNIAVPYPGTKLFEIAKKENRLNVKSGWSNFNVQFYMFADDIPYTPENTDRKQLIRDTFLANLMFCLRPKVLINFITSPVSGGMVLTLPKRWYLSKDGIRKVFGLFTLIIKRYIQILVV